MILSSALAIAQEEKTSGLPAPLKAATRINFTESYEQIKQLLPALSDLKVDVGDESTKATLSATLWDLPFTGQYSFARNQLISWGCRSDEIDHRTALAKLDRIIAELETSNVSVW